MHSSARSPQEFGLCVYESRQQTNLSFDASHCLPLWLIRSLLCQNREWWTNKTISQWTQTASLSPTLCCLQRFLSKSAWGRLKLPHFWTPPHHVIFSLTTPFLHHWRQVNIVSAMVNSLPSGYRHVVRETSPPSYWDSVAYSHLNLRNLVGIW